MGMENIKIINALFLEIMMKFLNIVRKLVMVIMVVIYGVVIRIVVTWN